MFNIKKISIILYCFIGDENIIFAKNRMFSTITNLFSVGKKTILLTQPRYITIIHSNYFCINFITPNQEKQNNNIY